jgi:hypothetical protein
MIHRTAFLLCLPALAFCSILPDTIGPLTRGDVVAAPAPDVKVWNEYGLQESETAPYTDPATAKKFTITAYRFSDSTGAFAAWIGIRPADAHKIEVDGMGVETATDQYIVVGNLLLVFHDFKPDKEQLAHVFLTAPKYSNSPLPTLPGFMPAGAVANSERYILGPASLARYAPVIPPSTAAFHFVSEAEMAEYAPAAGTRRTGKGAEKTTLVVFNFPGIEMAQKQYPLFAAIPGTVAKRSGPLVAIVLRSASPDDAERLLAQVKYLADVTVAEPPPTLKNNPANLFLHIMILCGVLIAFCVVSGLVFGGGKYLWRHSGSAKDSEEMVSLNLSGRP